MYPQGEYIIALILKGDYTYWKQNIKIHIIGYDIDVWETFKNDIYIPKTMLNGIEINKPKKK